MPRVHIERVLKKKGISHRRLAKLLGKEPKNISRLFRDGYNPRFNTLIEIARVVGCRVRDLIEE